MQLEVKQESFRIEMLMSRLQSECFNLCCKDLRSNELSMQEVRCVDRCSQRYLRTHDIIANAVDRGQSSGGKIKL
ncbi:hypothetical protein, conserved [Trypanosoma cruzi]|uniref:Mitochondrial import inner membrane translocase subunit n=1 Tax=Trypanosoma cruzi (strain CL Brener) TaxID=353153 RepID=Q4E1C1_TRYCC|nr:hypothetical protein, conserved [Trypanosoma cruzi]EAN98593.1 hypothetical protein, conserved [Trypanosoma cruzi]|eukprot:XP_820444.1 hypothetical protein [Trypanosoma cruzi strain CL Brener]